MTKRLCTEFVDPKILLASRLIALDKNPGVRPIGVGEIVRRLVTKAVLHVLRHDILDLVGVRARQGEWSQQFTLFKKFSKLVKLPFWWMQVLHLNRATALANVRSLCPSLAKLLINCYRESSDLYIDGEVIQSQEGTTQGDLLSMPFYALATIPLIKSLPNTVKQVWYADDGTALGSVRHLRNWWNELNSIGPSFGYFPNAVKTWLVVKEDQQLEAEALFHDTDINITCSGRPHLGLPLGTQQYKDQFISEKVSEWVEELRTLSTIASTEPHAAYAALTHGLSSRWLYLSRTMPSIDQHLQRLEEVLLEEVLPSTTDRDIFALPIRHGGLGICNPTYHADFEYTTSHAVCTPIINNITSGNYVYDHECECSQMTAKNGNGKTKKKSTCIEFKSTKGFFTIRRSTNIVTGRGERRFYLVDSIAFTSLWFLSS